MYIGDIPETVAKRLPVYYRNVCYMEAEGFEKVTSAIIAERTGNTGVQVRQDFFACGGIEGYKISEIKSALIRLLGIDKAQHMVIVGCGNLGRAIASYKDFNNDNFFIDAIFDNNLSLEGMQICGIPIMNVKLMENYIRTNKTDIVVIATPAKAAEEIFEKAVAAGVKGIWNFAPVDLRSCNGTEVRNVHLGDTLLTLSLRINEKNKFISK